MKLDLELKIQISDKFLIKLESFLRQIRFGEGVLSIGTFFFRCLCKHPCKII